MIKLYTRVIWPYLILTHWTVAKVHKHFMRSKRISFLHMARYGIINIRQIFSIIFIAGKRGRSYQSSAVMTRSNLSRYYIRHCYDTDWMRLGFQSQNRHPIPGLMGELLSVYCDDLGDNWPRYNGTAFYIYIYIVYIYRMTGVSSKYSLHLSFAITLLCTTPCVSWLHLYWIGFIAKPNFDMWHRTLSTTCNHNIKIEHLSGTTFHTT